ncbi:hypothetical protein BUALT_Bualt09G0033500 [Buddleja alternifolia]|uniref:CRM domain-containing protein n=1 Tax=Buddleja alternifolia TaxID=168488 RepID=A0AAV6X691_9LAMI|nr:hypothetical protein BUALT_Bualt09G0033500 [Buddleja alternifolia]
MALSPMPYNFLSPPSTIYPSHSPTLLKFHPHNILSFGPQKLKICCCQQTIQLDNETRQQTTPKKKKRKPRPSFLEQVQDKWSLKTPSLRENFPWQEEEIGDKNREFEAQRTRASKDVSSENGSVKSSSDVKIKSILAPWIHGNEPRKKVLNSEGLRKFEEKGLQKDETLVNFVQGSENPVKDVKLDGKIEEKHGKVETLGDEENTNATYVEDSSTVRRKVRSLNTSVDAERLPWERRIDEEFVEEDKLRNSNTYLAERLIPEAELKRLSNVSLRMVERMKVGAAGVTQALVDAIHEKWKSDEVVKLKFEGPPSMNMRRTHEILEVIFHYYLFICILYMCSRTGGLVILRSGGLVVLYRGLTYKLDCVKSYSKHIQADIGELGPSRDIVNDSRQRSNRVHNSNYFNNLSEEEQMDLSELNLLLDELGPRFMDWSGREPIPVDADLLPAIVPDYKTPFRLLPFGAKQALRNKEMTYLRQTARMLPPHFALGRNRELQGLAMAMVKLWKKSAIAKIAIKRGVQNTSNERMAEELKILTGGTLLSRNKEFIVFYRGNDFLPPNVSSALVEAEKSTALRQDEEEQARNRAATLIDLKANASKQPLVAGTLAETLAATSRWGNQPDGAEIEKMMRDTALAKHASLVNSIKRKLALAKGKLGRAEKALGKVLENQEPEDLPTDLETLSDEERFLFRRIGLSMKPYLLLGRREIFDGTIENMHLHWKYRELVKIIVDRKTFSQVKHLAVSLEAESGGVLVSVDRTTKGYVIIVYRGKNYQRPNAFRPKNLLTKRQALARSIELQRREALKHHVLELEEKVEKLKQELEHMRTANDNGVETLDSRADPAFDGYDDLNL